MIHDIKLIDDEKHKKFTGVSNKVILEGIRKLATEENVPIFIRYPLIPGYNDSAKDIEDAASFVAILKSKNIIGIEALPYHALGSSKYPKLGLNYELPRQIDVEESLERFKRIAAVYNIPLVRL